MAELQPNHQASYPQTVMNITANGVSFTIFLGPSIAIQHFIDAENMEKLTRGWRESRRELASQQAIIADVLRTKL